MRSLQQMQVRWSLLRSCMRLYDLPAPAETVGAIAIMRAARGAVALVGGSVWS